MAKQKIVVQEHTRTNPKTGQQEKVAAHYRDVDVATPADLHPGQTTAIKDACASGALDDAWGVDDGAPVSTPSHQTWLSEYDIDWGPDGEPAYDPARAEQIRGQYRNALINIGHSNLEPRDALMYMPTTVTPKARISGNEIGVVDNGKIRLFRRKGILTDMHMVRLVNQQGVPIGRRRVYHLEDGGEIHEDSYNHHPPTETFDIVEVNHLAAKRDAIDSMTEEERKKLPPDTRRRQGVW